MSGSLTHRYSIERKKTKNTGFGPKNVQGSWSRNKLVINFVHNHYECTYDVQQGEEHLAYGLTRLASVYEFRNSQGQEEQYKEYKEHSR